MTVADHLNEIPSAAVGMNSMDSYEIAPEVFEAFSYAEPITTNMTSAFDPTWVGHS